MSPTFSIESRGQSRSELDLLASLSLFCSFFRDVRWYQLDFVDITHIISRYLSDILLHLLINIVKNTAKRNPIHNHMKMCQLNLTVHVWNLFRFSYLRYPEILTSSRFAGTHSGVRPRCAWEICSPGHETSPQEVSGPVSPDEIQSGHTGKPEDQTW